MAELLARVVYQQLPEITSILRMPKQRQKRVYLDHVQNGRGKTLASAYSLRPWPGATVSTPLKWAEEFRGTMGLSRRECLDLAAAILCPLEDGGRRRPVKIHRYCLGALGWLDADVRTQDFAGLAYHSSYRDPILSTPRAIGR